MKNIYNNKLILLIMAATIFVSCEDWNEVEAKYQVEYIETGSGHDEEYYKNLRAFKATMLDRKLSWGWFGGWAGVGAFMNTSLSGLPDSLDIVSLWGDWTILTEARKKDLEYVQKVKGTKVVACSLIGDIGQGFTPEGVDFNEYWGWEGDIKPSNKNEVPTEAQEKVIRKYARLTAELILENGYDGYDIDYEIGYGSSGNLVEYPERLLVYVDELSKYFGPKSGTDKLLIIDGAIRNVPKKIALYFDLYVIQAYRASSFNNLNTGDNRFSQAVNNFKDLMPINEIAEKIVMTEEYEQSQWKTGGVNFTLPDRSVVNSLKGMALWVPEYGGVKYPRSGGSGVYHIEYEYDATATNGYSGFYPWIREAIQVMNPSPANQK